ncbi:MAG TPA: metallopeptidase family protein [Thermoanaerobaculia bacterium]|nr:metallopeptidase family protein [Thermoanaerobaculia bacterium]
MSGSWRITPHEFESLVEEALHELPDQFRDLLENIAIVIESEPSEEDFDLLEDLEDDGDDSDELLGIFRGIPRTEKSFDALPALPDQIAIFRGPILRVSASRRDAIQEIRETVIHELGHYFGLSDDEMPF